MHHFILLMRALLPVAGVAFFGGTGAGTLAFLVPVWWMGSVTTDALLRLRGHGGRVQGGGNSQGKSLRSKPCQVYAIPQQLQVKPTTHL